MLIPGPRRALRHNPRHALTTSLRALACLVATAALAPAAPAAAALAPAYALIDVGTFGGPQAFVNLPGYPITSRGAVLGTADTTIADADFPNFNPFMVGFPDPTLVHAFAWQNGQLQDLGALPGNNSSAVFQVNASGSGVGMSETPVTDPFTGWPADHATMFKDGQVIDLGTLPGGFESQAIAINDRGQIAGDSYTNATPNPETDAPTTDPFLWTNGHMRDLGTLGGTQSATNWLNNSGEVVGQSNVAGDQSFHPTCGAAHTCATSAPSAATSGPPTRSTTPDTSQGGRPCPETKPRTRSCGRTVR